MRRKEVTRILWFSGHLCQLVRATKLNYMIIHYQKTLRMSVRVGSVVLLYICQLNAYFYYPTNTTMHIWYFFIIRPTRCTNFANLFFTWNSTCFGQCLCLSLGVHSLYTVVYVVQVCRQLSSRTRLNILVLLGMCLQTCMTYATAECTVNELVMMDRGTVRNM